MQGSSRLAGQQLHVAVLRRDLLLLAVLLAVCWAGPVHASCPAGQYYDELEERCKLCDTDTYQPTTNTDTECLSCPTDSFAHRPGSTGCIACYLGQPVVMAGVVDGQAGTYPTLPDEQPKPGFKIVRVTSELSTCAASPFSGCTTTTNRLLALDIDQSCRVKAFVLGDSQCSVASDLIMAVGVFTSTNTIRAADDSMAINLAAMSATFTDTSDGGSGASCTASLAAPAAGTCPAGTRTEANPEDDGELSVLLATHCVPCDAGNYCTSGSTSSCPAGTYSDLDGTTTCSNCGSGFISGEGSTACVQCDAGTTPGETKDTCELCPAGHFATVNGAPCEPCPAGTYRGADMDGTSCQACAAGTFSAAGAGVCTPCVEGTASNEEGTQNACPNCPAGSYAAGPGSFTCEPCPEGFYSPLEGASVCLECGAGEFSVTSSDGTGATGCQKCAVGWYKPAEAKDNKCRSCPPGYETGTTAEGASQCTPCLAGYVSPTSNTALCSPCPAGSMASTTGLKECTVCEGGFITGLTNTNARAGDGPKTGKSAVAATTCDPCPRRSFRPYGAANECTVCPKGRQTYKPSGAFLCSPCASGSTLLKTGGLWDVTCTPCKPGEYQKRQASSEGCLKCDPGTFTKDAGNSICDDCDAGSYQEASGATSCKTCLAGTYSKQTVAGPSGKLTACLKAPPGFFAVGTGNEAPEMCGDGMYQNEEGKGSCKICPPGFACPRGTATPIPCQPGFYSDKRMGSCIECWKGTFQDKPGQRSCRPCQPGKFCPSNKMAAGRNCPPGTFGNTVGTVTQLESCKPCPINSFSSAAGSTKCERCPNGQWTNRRPGQWRCWSTQKKVP